MNFQKTALSRIEKSWMRSFFTLPESMKNLSHSISFTRRNSNWIPNLENAAHLTLGGIRYYIIWLGQPEIIKESQIDLAFRDFSYYGETPVVLIRQSQKVQ